MTKHPHDRRAALPVPAFTLGAMAVMAVACTRAPAPKPEAPPVVAPETADDWPSCGAGSLPRITERAFVDHGLEPFFASAAKGSVAVVWDGDHARVVEACQLDGRYVEARGSGASRFWATNRVLFRTDEITGECRTATHVVAAYVATDPRLSSGAAPAPSKMSGILVPLPCPSADDPKPSAGCIARGTTGPERRQKADAIRKELTVDRVPSADPAKGLEVFALIPDEDSGLMYAMRVDGDAPLLGQGEWLGSQYMRTESSNRTEESRLITLLEDGHRRPPPTIDWGCSDFNPSCTPVFLWCFRGYFRPLLSPTGRWTPAKVYQ